MATKSKKSAAIGIACAVAAVIFFIIVIAVMSFVGGDESDPFLEREVDPYMTFTSMDVEVEWNNDRSCHVTQNIHVLFHEDAYGNFDAMNAH
ncbi:MAG: hypothetical protein K2M48_06120, partial [Clostridiales bacterium]|nr:hypothetical protein [Clostridiales bacterium]